MAQINVNYSPYRNEFRAQRSLASEGSVGKKEVWSMTISPSMMVAGLMLMAILLSGLYLLNFNRVATKGYQLKRLEVSQQELKSENDLRTLYLAKSKSMNGIVNDNRLEGMRKPGSVEFVYGESVLAKAN